MTETIQKLPLFPLGTVLFPGAELGLHIFEERYRLMIGRCLAERTPFGVVLLRQGSEVEEGRAPSAPAEPFEIGTIAEIVASERLDDGRYLLSAVGTRRFRTQYMLQRAPYLIASVAVLPDLAPLHERVEARAHQLRTTYQRYFQQLAVAIGSPQEVEELPNDPIALSFRLAERMQVPTELKQRWLEVDASRRISELTALLKREMVYLPSGPPPPEQLPPGSSLN